MAYNLLKQKICALHDFSKQKKNLCARDSLSLKKYAIRDNNVQKVHVHGRNIEKGPHP